MSETKVKEGYSNVELDLEKDELYELMLMAHEQDITLNQLVENILVKYMDQYEVGKLEDALEFEKKRNE